MPASNRDQHGWEDEETADEPLLEAGRRSGLEDDGWGNEEELRAKAAKKSDNIKLLASFLAMVFFGLGNKIFQKVMTIPMKNYPFFLNIWSTMIYIPISFVYIVPMMALGRITKEERAVPQHKFMVMGVLDGLASLMQVFAVTKIASGALLILLSQAAIPISMLISRILLRTQYKASQYLGASVVIAGIGIVLYPQFHAPPPLIPPVPPSLEEDTVDAKAFSTLLWAGVMMASCLPMALSSVFKESAMANVDMDAVYLNGYIAIYQFATCIPSAYPAALAEGMSIEDMPGNIWRGFLCYTGHNSIVNASNPADNDDCAAAPFDVNVYLCFNVMYNILMILILKYGSANIMFMALTLMVPLGNMAFSLPWVPGHQDLTVFDYSGLCVIMTGLVCYRFGGKIQRAIGGGGGGGL